MESKEQRRSSIRIGQHQIPIVESSEKEFKKKVGVE